MNVLLNIYLNLKGQNVYCSDYLDDDLLIINEETSIRLHTNEIVHAKGFHAKLYNEEFTINMTTTTDKSTPGETIDDTTHQMGQLQTSYSTIQLTEAKVAATNTISLKLETTRMKTAQTGTTLTPGDIIILNTKFQTGDVVQTTEVPMDFQTKNSSIHKRNEMELFLMWSKTFLLSFTMVLISFAFLSQIVYKSIQLTRFTAKFDLQQRA